MNPDTGELRRLARGERMPDGFEEVPSALDLVARLKMARAVPVGFAPAQPPSAKVNLRSQSPLAAWAKKKRLAKIAAKSRRRNRK